MGNKKATGFLCLRLVPCFAYVGAEDNRKGIPFVKIVSLLCKLIQFLMVALSVTVHKALILLVFLNHPYQSLAFARLSAALFAQLAFNSYPLSHHRTSAPLQGLCSAHGGQRAADAAGSIAVPVHPAVLHRISSHSPLRPG